MIEIDAPYLLPRTVKPRPSHRRNEPMYLAHIVEELARELGTDVLRGLSRLEAQRRLEQQGANELPTAARKPPWRILLAQVQNVLIAILLLATGLSIALGHAGEAAAIAAIACGNRSGSPG